MYVLGLEMCGIDIGLGLDLEAPDLGLSLGKKGLVYVTAYWHSSNVNHT